nr:PLP-dependent aminotransferase family protein [uncultured Cohaesibacter sp.]
MQNIDSETLAGHLKDRSATGIARDTAILVRNGVLPVGARLPSLRDLAYELKISPSTLSQAWKELRRLRVLTGRGRNGTYVTGSSFAPRPSRVSAQGHFESIALNLSVAVPDMDLLPPLGKALDYGTHAEGLNSYVRVRILPELERVLRPLWPNHAAAMLATNGGYNALYTALHALVPPGSVVAVEAPVPMRILDILEDLRVSILLVENDVYGSTPQSLQAILKENPSVFILQPRISSVTGLFLHPDRMKELGDILSKSDALIIEDDGLGDISLAPPQSLGDRFPDRAIHIRSFSKAYGPDLRMAVLSGPEYLVEQIQSYRAFSAAWTSRILQAAVAWLLQDSDTQALVRKASETYRDRRNLLARQLTARGIHVPEGAGLCLYAPVHSETFSLITLAAHNIAATPGSSFAMKETGHIRLGTGQLDNGKIEHLANIFQLSAGKPFVFHPD